MADNILSNPHRALPWAAQNGYDVGSAKAAAGYRFWLQFDPDQARTWLADNAPQWTANGQHQTLTGLTAEEYLLAQQARNESKIDEAARRTLTAYGSWKTANPSAAEDWLDTAPTPLRELIHENANNPDE